MKYRNKKWWSVRGHWLFKLGWHGPGRGWQHWSLCCDGDSDPYRYWSRSFWIGLHLGFITIGWQRSERLYETKFREFNNHLSLPDKWGNRFLSGDVALSRYNHEQTIQG